MLGVEGIYGGTTAVVEVQSWLADGLPTTFPTLIIGELGAGERVGLLRDEYSTIYTGHQRNPM